MGYTSYSLNARSARSEERHFLTNSIDQNFTQNSKRQIHDSMSPMNLKIREARDSVAHPNTVPIILALDVTGSMGMIPQQLVIDGLPKLMGGIIEHGIHDPALLFLAIGDTQKDQYPLQVAQFESGDAELDMWLTRTYIERGGGGNNGESYLVSWLVAAFHTATDAWDKRNEKGFLFTVGDEPCLKSISSTEIKEMIGSGERAYSDSELLKLAQEKWNVYHLQVMQGSDGVNGLRYWKEMLGENCIRIEDYKTIPDVITEIITKGNVSKVNTTVSDTKQSEEYL